MKNKRCGECGSRDLHLKNQKGKPFPWKDYPAVFLNKDHKVLECAQCENTVESGADVAALSKAIQETVIEQTQAFIETILTREGCKQTELAAHLGVSPEHLSEIKSGRKQPSFQTYNFLKTLAFENRSFKVSDPQYNTLKIAM
ncbi:helix-turn-helix transcriptional regulator [Bdellovibrionota bacterium FG-1]